MKLFDKLNYNLYKNNLLNPKNADIEFIEVEGHFAAFPQLGIKLAKDVELITEKYQEKTFGAHNFPKCPGMLDYSRLGYIVPAWSVIKIKANSAGSSCYSQPDPKIKKLQKVLQFDQGIIDGVFNPDKGIGSTPIVHNVACPWRVRTKPGISLLVLPAYYHCKHLDDLHMFPGVIDYDRGFSVLNAVFAAKRKCEVTINPGEPLLHLIPIMSNKEYSAEYGYEKNFDTAPVRENSFTPIKNFYRKYFMTKKKFKLKYISDKK